MGVLLGSKNGLPPGEAITLAKSSWARLNNLRWWCACSELLLNEDFADGVSITRKLGNKPHTGEADLAGCME